MRLKGTYTLIKQKYFFCLLLLCLMVTSSCGNLFTGEETIFDPDRDESIREESVPVMVAFDDPYYNILSRGVGKIDPEDEWFNNKMNPVDEEGVPLDPKYKPRFFVYAFRQNNPYGYDITRKYDKNICLVDGSCGTQAEYALAHPEECSMDMVNGHIIMGMVLLLIGILRIVTNCTIAIRSNLYPMISLLTITMEPLPEPLTERTI